MVAMYVAGVESLETENGANCCSSGADVGVDEFGADDVCFVIMTAGFCIVPDNNKAVG